MNFFSIAIPTYEMHGLGVIFLENIFKGLHAQLFSDFEVVISDHSKNDDIEQLCSKWNKNITIKYIKCEHKRGNFTANLNNAIKHCSGKWIKILFQDDFFYSDRSLLSIHNHITSNKNNWYVTGCVCTNNGIDFFRPFLPAWNDNMHSGNNTLGSPTLITFENTPNKIFFDEELIWMMDIDFYLKMYKSYKEPGYNNDINIVNRIWKGSVSNTLCNQELRTREQNIILERYKKRDNY